jgi:hypothetical protein
MSITHFVRTVNYRQHDLHRNGKNRRLERQGPLSILDTGVGVLVLSVSSYTPVDAHEHFRRTHHAASSYRSCRYICNDSMSCIVSVMTEGSITVIVCNPHFISHPGNPYSCSSLLFFQSVLLWLACSTDYTLLRVDTRLAEAPISS